MTSVAFSSLRLATLNCSKTSQSRISAVIAYYTALALDVIEDSQELSDQLLRNFFLYILGGISGKIPSEYEFSENLNENTQESWLQSACMLISQISRRVNLSRTILNSLLVSLTQRIRSKVDISGSGYISQHNDDDNIDILDHSVENILMVVIILVRYQKVRITGSILQTMFVDYHPPYETSFIVLRCIENLRLRYASHFRHDKF